jgi:hypothetical protein
MILRRHQWWLALLMLAIPGMAGAIKFDSPYYYSMSHFEMPEDMNQFTSVQMLADNFLNTDNPFLRRAAVRRIGQLKDVAAIPILIKTYQADVDPTSTGHSSPKADPLLKGEIIRALDQIGGDEANQFILKQFDAYARRPSVSKYEMDNSRRTGGYPFFEIFKAVSRHAAPKIMEQLESIALNDKIPEEIREQAWANYYRMKMRRENVTGSQPDTEYLLDRMSGPGVGKKEDFEREGGKANEAIRNSGIMILLVEIGEAALPVLEARRAQIPENENSRRRETIDYAIKVIRQQAKSKAEAKDFWRRYWKEETGHQ